MRQRNESGRSDTALEAVLHRECAIVVSGLVGMVVLAWAYLLVGAGLEMQAMGDMAKPMPSWSAGYFGLVLLMWAVMMLAMMLPSAAPMILLYAAIARRRQARGGALGATGLFVLGYVVIWTVFSLGATTLQWALDRTALLSPMMQTTSATVAGLVLIAAGVYQWTLLKQACLRWCRSPLGFVMRHWRDGVRGAFRMGLRHGLYCLGCCWMLMLLLFVAGVMNVLWIAGLTLLVLVEKVVAHGHWLGRALGVVLIAWGGATLALLPAG
ncbi:DUF2182 domain-containing protein [Halomonas sp. LBP4]|nr:DUF2182 domain-containing protein [Halomonas sp. LBP4]PXX98338.1 hypothetical protein CR157_08465 [Halomonas sp. LBP4]